jgi:hypothetical protein
MIWSHNQVHASLSSSTLCDSRGRILLCAGFFNQYIGSSKKSDNVAGAMFHPSIAQEEGECAKTVVRLMACVRPIRMPEASSRKQNG